MTALDNNPTTTNFLSPVHFDFHIKRSPQLNYFVQKVVLPGMRLDPANEETPFVQIPYPGEHLEFETLDIVFAVDEKLKNYMDLYNWKRGLGTPDDLTQYKPLRDAPIYTGAGPTSEITVFIMNSAKNPIYTFTFHNAYPNSLSGFTLDTTADDVEYVKASCSFEFSSYDIDPV